MVIKRAVMVMVLAVLVLVTRAAVNVSTLPTSTIAAHSDACT